MDVRSDFSDTISVWVDGLDLNGLTRGVCVCVCVCYQVNTIVNIIIGTVSAIQYAQGDHYYKDINVNQECPKWGGGSNNSNSNHRVKIPQWTRKQHSK